jgi:four helix bundle protein
VSTFEKFEDIEAWKKARVLNQEVYQITRQGLFANDFGLRDQIRRASVSVMSNIAEGFERNGTGEFVQFLAIAKGSAGEVRSQLYTALDQRYIDQQSFDRLLILTGDISNMIGSLMNYLRRSNVKGTKYKNR